MKNTVGSSKRVVLAVLSSVLGLTACGESTPGGLGIEFELCGTSQWVARSRGASNTYEQKLTVDFSSNQEFARYQNQISDMELKQASVEVVAVAADNTATTASGKLEVGPMDESRKILLGEYRDRAIRVGNKVDFPLSQEGKDFAMEQLRGGAKSFKAWVTGSVNHVPANVTLKVKFIVLARIGGATIHRALDCISFSAQTSSAASCNPNPCQNSGVCVAERNTATCFCPLGTTGIQCETVVASPCVPNPCQNGGTCAEDADAGTAMCTCPPGFGGPTCEEQDACNPNPCQHDGTCTLDVDAGAVCSCSGSFSGDRCQFEDACANNPCQNNGTCSSDHGRAVCRCAAGFAGETCSTCASGYFGSSCTRCQCGSGTCQDGVSGSGACTCAAGFTGAACGECQPGFWGARCSPCTCSAGATCNDGKAGNGACTYKLYLPFVRK